MLAHLKTQKIQLNTPLNVSWTAVLSRVRDVGAKIYVKSVDIDKKIEH